MPDYQHYGLYFSSQQVQQAQNSRDDEPFKTAWTFLARPDSPTSGSVLAEVFWLALQYRLNNQSEAGEAGVAALQNGVGAEEGETLFETLRSTLMLAHTFEMVRDHPAFSQEAQSAWFTRFADLNYLVSKAATPSAEIGLVEQLWSGLRHIVVGIVTEHQPAFEAGVEIYQQAIEHDIRPEGHLPRAVEGEDGGSLERQLLSVAALVLMAEAASHVGVDLWNYASRGISVVTAVSYCIYYYYYPDQWRWDTIAEEQSNTLYREHGAFLEMVNARLRPKDLKLLLKNLRPFYSPFCGGLTTLTHGIPARHKMFR